MPQSPKTIGFVQQTTPTIKSEMEAKCLSATNTPNNNTIFSFPSIPPQDDKRGADMTYDSMSTQSNNVQYNAAYRHQEGKQLDVNDVNVNVNVVASSSCASSSHEQISTSSNTLSSSESSSTNNNNQSSKLNVINVCSDKTNTNDGIIITEAQSNTTTAGFYDSMKVDSTENGETTTAIIYETIVIENPPMQSSTKNQHDQIISFVTTASSGGSSNNNNKLIANKNMNLSLDHVGGNGGILVLTGSLNDLLNSHVITNCLSQSSNSGAGANSKCLNLNEKKSNTNHIQSIVLNLNSQSSAPTSGQLLSAGQKSIRLAINQTQQVCVKCVKLRFKNKLTNFNIFEPNLGRFFTLSKNSTDFKCSELYEQSRTFSIRYSGIESLNKS
jgi:hypothetical protein